MADHAPDPVVLKFCQAPGCNALTDTDHCPDCVVELGLLCKSHSPLAALNLTLKLEAEQDHNDELLQELAEAHDEIDVLHEAINAHKERITMLAKALYEARYRMKEAYDTTTV